MKSRVREEKRRLLFERCRMAQCVHGHNLHSLSLGLPYSQIFERQSDALQS